MVAESVAGPSSNPIHPDIRRLVCHFDGKVIIESCFNWIILTSATNDTNFEFSLG